MSGKNFDFDLRIDKNGDDWKVEVSSPAGDAEVKLDAPLNENSWQGTFSEITRGAREPEILAHLTRFLNITSILGILTLQYLFILKF